MHARPYPILTSPKHVLVQTHTPRHHNFDFRERERKKSVEIKCIGGGGANTLRHSSPVCCTASLFLNRSLESTSGELRKKNPNNREIQHPSLPPKATASLTLLYI